MRPRWLFLVGISLLGCKDKQPATPAPTPAPSSPSPQGSAQPAAAAPAEHSAPVTAPIDRPSLEKAFEAEVEDKVWADATEAAIQAVAPELADVACRQSQCEATIHGLGLPQIAMAADKLESADKLPATGAKHVLLTAPENTPDGKAKMKIFIRYER